MPHIISETMGEISFEDATNSSKIFLETQTYGSAWGDLNGDGWPDLWTGNHFKKANLYLNNQDGTFTDVSSKLGLIAITEKDLHGSSWVDFDNDGDQDLLVLAGAEGGEGSDPNLLLVNDNGALQDSAEDYGIDFPLGRARAPIWFDWDHDGLLDLIISNLPRPDGKAQTAFFHQTKNGFENFTPEDGFDIIRPYGAFQIPASNSTAHIFYSTPYEEGIYNLSDFLIKNFTNPMKLREPQSVDLSIEDFNGDLLVDLFQTKSDLSPYAIIEDPNNVFTRLLLRNAGEQNLKLLTNGTIHFHFITLEQDFSMENLYIGSEGFQQEISDIDGLNNWFDLELNPEGGFSFSLSPDDKRVWGILDHNQGVDTGLFIGYDPNNMSWEIQFSSPERSKVEFQITSTDTILDLIHNEPEFNTVFQNDQLLIQTKSGFEDLTISSGFDSPTSCGSIGAGDFDNDMDIDIYLVCSVSTKNLPNILYENIGNGQFIAVDNAGGAEGSDLGIGDAVSIADYNMDGFLDLFVTNGEHSRGFKNIAPSQLFKNMGNENHWLEIDLDGTTSNHDGIGARVYIISNNTHQVQEQLGAIHYRSQDSQIIHFGLGQNELVDSITVHWPSGIIQEMKNVPADQIIRIVETIPIESLKNQISKGINVENIKCKNDLELILKASTSEFACVKPNSVKKLIDREWGMLIN